MRLVYFGSGAFGLPTLEKLSERHDVVALVTQPDRPAGRRQTLSPTPIAAWSSEHIVGARILKPARVNAPEVVDEIRGLRAEAWVIIAFGQKLGADLLEGQFAINLHASRLPRWRGAAPINHAILAGDSITGNSVITLASQMDAGEILAQSGVSIGPETTAGALHDQLAADGPALVASVLDDFEGGRLDPRPQDESQVTLAPKLSRRDAWVDFSLSANECHNRINGLSPWPGVSAGLNGIHLKLIRVRVEEAPAPSEQDSDPIGALIDPEKGLVACGSASILRLLEVQPAGKRVMTWDEFARGRGLDKGFKLEMLATC